MGLRDCEVSWKIDTAAVSPSFSSYCSKRGACGWKQTLPGLGLGYDGLQIRTKLPISGVPAGPGSPRARASGTRCEDQPCDVGKARLIGVRTRGLAFVQQLNKNL